MTFCDLSPRAAQTMRGQVTIVPPQDVTKRCQAAPQRQPRVLAAPRVNHAGFGARTRGDKLHNSLRKTTVTSHNFIRDPYDKLSLKWTKKLGKDVLRTERKHPYFEAEDSEGLRMLRRILITLSVYDTEVSYVQGMNELVAPLLLILKVCHSPTDTSLSTFSDIFYIIVTVSQTLCLQYTLQDESLTFWCFVKLMPQLRDRLLTLDISPQLSSTADLIQHFDEELYNHIEKITCGHWLFCFRWFLLLFKNEFKMDSILRLWDILFAQHNTAHFEIFFASALIITNKEQVLACATSDQILYWAQSVTAKLDIAPVIKHARDLSYALCAVVDTLPPKLSALVTQAGQVPPPLVGFVRHQQQFETRPVMNSDLIRRLLQGTTETHTTVRHTTPMFFNCTESPIPIPSQNYLPVITGATPLALAREPELAPPPTSGGMVGGARGGRGGRPDALVEDKVSNRPVVNSGNSGYHGQYDGNHGYHGGQSDGYHYGADPNGYHGNSGGNYGHNDVNQAQGYPPQHDGNHSYAGHYDGNHGYAEHYDSNHGYTPQYNGNHGYPTAAGGSSCPPSYQPPTDQQLPPAGTELNQSTASGGTEHGSIQTPSTDNSVPAEAALSSNSGGNYGHYDVNQAHGYPAQDNGNQGYAGQYDGNYGYPEQYNGNYGQYDGNHGYLSQYNGNHGYPTAAGGSSYPPSYQPPTDQQLPQISAGTEPNQSRASGGTEHGSIQTPSTDNTAPAAALSKNSNRYHRSGLRA
eukprot:sb/3462387/